MAGGRKDDDDRTDLGGRHGFGQGSGQGRGTYEIDMGIGAISKLL